VENRKSYGQFCALARALDHIGDRWTLLVVRELLIGPKTYRDLHRSLPGISPNLLVERLRNLTADGIVVRSDGPARSKAVLYRLTDAGLELQPAVAELIRWGARWMASGPQDDHVEAEWAILALRALLEGAGGRRGGRGVVHVDADGVWLTVRVGPQGRTVLPGRIGIADGAVSASVPDLLAVASGIADGRFAGLNVDGDAGTVAAALGAPER
jgi:DNA-binding HxlR family transcriptional regulator